MFCTIDEHKPTAALSAVGKDKAMKAVRLVGVASIGLLSFLGLISWTAVAQTTKVEGIIKSRSGPDMILKTSQDPDFVVLLADSTDVGQVQGLFKARRKKMSMAALIPGLAVSVEGRYNNQNVLAARKVRFKGDDLKQAEAIEAGMHDVKTQVQQNQAELERQNAELKAQNEALQKHQAAIEANQSKIAANKAAVDAAVARFGQLDDYYIMDELTVYFDNGKVDVEQKYVPQLVDLAQKAHGVEGYMIEVKGYASAAGSAAVNQRLSEDRADNVTNILLQQGKVPLTRMLAPGAMGESEQVGNEKTDEGQAENRRVVIRVLQNKAIAGV